MNAPRNKSRQPQPRRDAQARTRGAQAAPAKAPRSRLGKLTPDALRREWELHHPERPEVAAALERLYRRRY